MIFVITNQMIEAAAQRLVRWDDNCVWPDSWDPLTVTAARHDAERALRSGLVAAGYKPYTTDEVEMLGLRNVMADY